jgi:hypothetical protein
MVNVRTSSRIGRGRAWTGALAIAIVSGTAIGFMAGQAWADTCPGSQPIPGGDIPHNTIMRASADGRGVKIVNPGMKVYDVNVDCGRVSSIQIHQGTAATFVEVGWYENPGDGYFCLDATSGPPNLLAYQQLGTVRDCLHDPSNLTDGDTDSFSVYDADQNGVWKYWHEGNLIFTGEDMGSFNSGIPLTNGERNSRDDVARAKFNGLQRMNENQNWVAWQSPANPGSPPNDDPGYKNCVYQDDHIAAWPNSQAC